MKLPRGAPIAHLRSRAIWAAGAATVGLIARCAGPAPPARTVEGVAAMLGAAVGGEVRAEDFVWEPRSGFFVDTFVGRRVLFLARLPGAGAARDLYRARVELTRAGRPLGVRDVHDLTRSPGGDDANLVAEGTRVAFTTSAGGVVQGVTLLDLAGPREPAPGLRGALERWRATGSLRGAARTEVVFGAPPAAAKIELEGDLLVMSLGEGAAPAALHVSTRALDVGDRDPYRARVRAIDEEVPPWSTLLAETAREVFGDGASRFVAARFQRAPSAGSRAPMPAPPGGAPVAAASADGDRVANASSTWVDWPPSGVAWVAPAAPFLPEQKDAPPYVVEGALDVATAHGTGLVRLVAIDTRRVDLRLEAGTHSPRSTTGLHGIGALPTGPIAARVVGLFATGPAEGEAFADDAEPSEASAAHGVVVERAVLVPPAIGASTLAFLRDGSVRYGAWPDADLPAEVASLRQTSAPLAAQSPRSGARERSAMCTLSTGHVVVAFARDVEAADLARGLAPLGCASILPLATAPGDTGFAFVHRVESEGSATWESLPIAPGMAFGDADLARGLRGDFAYLVLREAGPGGGKPAAPRPDAPAAVAWMVDAGTQPAPAFIPAVFAATLTELGAQVHLMSFLPGRFTFRARAGARELSSRTGAPLAGTLDDGEQARALAAFGLGTARRKAPRGFATGGATAIAFHGDLGALVADGGAVRVVKSDGYAPSAGADAVELPMTADDGKLRPAARDVGTMRPRSAACARDDGALLVAWTTFDTDEATTQALLDAGCPRVVALDRGSHGQAFASRTGGGEPALERRYEMSTLYVVEAPLRGRAAPF